jgi:ERCC4-type nuclease
MSTTFPLRSLNTAVPKKRSKVVDLLPTIYVAHNEATNKPYHAEQYLPNMRRTQSEDDYVWFGHNHISVGVERKRFRDLVTCILHTHRHLEQLHRMRWNYDVVYLVVEGQWRRGMDGLLETPEWTTDETGRRRMHYLPTTPPIGWDVVVKHLETIERRMGVRVRRTENYVETCQYIINYSAWWTEPVEAHTSVMEMPEPFQLMGRVSLAARVASRLPGIGAKLAIKVAQSLRTPHEMDQASVEDWAAALGYKSGAKSKDAQAAYRAWHTLEGEE